MPRRTHRFPLRLAGEPLELARLLGGPRVVNARWLPIEDRGWRTRIAQAVPAPAGSGTPGV